VATAFAVLSLSYCQAKAAGQNKEQNPCVPKEEEQKDNGQNSSKLTESIVLGKSANNSVQVKAISQAGKMVWEIQLGGGSNQPPSNTNITGPAFIVLGGTKYSGHYRLSTNPATQLRMKIKTIGKTPGVDNDVYNFVAGHAVLNFEFAPTSSFANPWLTGQIANVSATQLVLNEDNGNEHPPILITGKIGVPTGGSLATFFAGGSSMLVLDVGGNQMLSKLQAGNTLSGMKLKEGSKYSPTHNSAQKD
jgi:hypothetical protein